MEYEMVFRLVCFLALNMVVLGNAFAAEDAGAKSPGVGPVIKIFHGGKCVDDTEFMRRNHMDLIGHQRDDTLRRGIRTGKYSLKACVNCHANPETNSVLGKDGFCETCHTYTVASPDCFTCHSASPEKKNPTPKAAHEPNAATAGNGTLAK